MLEEGWTLTFYNVLFTVLPPVVLGVFDQFVGARMLDRYPELYKLGQQNAFVSLKRLQTRGIHRLILPTNYSSAFGYSGNGSPMPWRTPLYVARFLCQILRTEPPLLQVIYAVSVAIFWENLILPQGWIGGQWVWGTTLYLSALLTVLAKAALISEYAGNKALTCRV